MVRETIALKATVDPMFMKLSNSEMTDDKAMDQRGRCVEGWTRRGQYMCLRGL